MRNLVLLTQLRLQLPTVGSFLAFAFDGDSQRLYVLAEEDLLHVVELREGLAKARRSSEIER
jgi:hypothetical protein